MDLDKRGALRVPFTCEAECSGMGTSARSPRITDVSTTGVFIDTMTEMPPGSRMTIRFRVDSTDICVDTEIAHAMAGIGMGARFLNLTPEQQAAIERLVAQQPA
jgi:hypothetical protein